MSVRYSREMKFKELELFDFEPEEKLNLLFDIGGESYGDGPEFH